MEAWAEVGVVEAAKAAVVRAMEMMEEAVLAVEEWGVGGQAAAVQAAEAMVVGWTEGAARVLVVMGVRATAVSMEGELTAVDVRAAAARVGASPVEVAEAWVAVVGVVHTSWNSLRIRRLFRHIVQVLRQRTSHR